MRKGKVIKRINPVFLKGICHRGLHNEQYTENGLLAFKNAMDHGMAFEFDIHLTKDKHLVVIHDSDLKRVTGKEGIVEEKTLQELKSEYRLLNGEEIPTFQEVLNQTNEVVPIVIELKAYEKNYFELGKALVDELESKIKDRKNYMIISFDPRALASTKSLHIMRSLLITKTAKWVFRFRHLFESLDVEDCLLEEKEYQEYSIRHLVNVWTIEKEEQLNKVIKYADLITFQHMDVELIKTTCVNKNQDYLK